jgi:hypothetical protein
VKYATIIILPDGETWSTIDGCEFVVIDNTQYIDLCDGNCSTNDLKPVAEIQMKEWAC